MKKGRKDNGRSRRMKKLMNEKKVKEMNKRKMN